MDLTEAREAHARAQAEFDAAAADYAELYTKLQFARSNNKPLEELELQGQLVRALQRRSLSQQLLDGHAARLKVIEKKAMQDLQDDVAKTYAATARVLALTLAQLMDLDQRLGHVQFRCPGIGRFAVPAWNGQRADDTGCLMTFTQLQVLMPEAAKANDARLAKETEHA